MRPDRIPLWTDALTNPVLIVDETLAIEDLAFEIAISRIYHKVDWEDIEDVTAEP